VLKQIHNADELFDLLILGNKNRTQHPTDANEESSRSHAIFQVHIRMTDKKTSVRRTVKLSMIDLAGSERAQSTKCKGLRFKEGANINKSLLALGNCINKLADGCKHIPYRDSNLTRILKDSLGGNCQTVSLFFNYILIAVSDDLISAHDRKHFTIVAHVRRHIQHTQIRKSR
jgi:kinesin family member 18/19